MFLINTHRYSLPLTCMVVESTLPFSLQNERNVCHIAAMEGQLQCLEYLCNTEVGAMLLLSKDEVRKVHMMIDRLQSRTRFLFCPPVSPIFYCNNLVTRLLLVTRLQQPCDKVATTL